MRIEGLRPAVEAVHREMPGFVVSGRSAEAAPPGWNPTTGHSVTAHDGASFAAGQQCGTRIAACVARLAALELLDGSRWWNRRRRRLMARALVACAEEMESSADVSSAREGTTVPTLATVTTREPT